MKVGLTSMYETSQLSNGQTRNEKTSHGQSLLSKMSGTFENQHLKNANQFMKEQMQEYMEA